MHGTVLPARAAARLASVKLRAASADALVARLRLERALEQVDWSAPGVPSAGIVVVKSLAIEAGEVDPGWPARLPRRITAALRGQVQAARRPWLQPDAAGAQAVLFADEAELVACLVRDWLDGRVAERWWWRGVLGRQSAREWLRDNVLVRAEALAPALARLAERAAAVSFVARLSEDEAETAVAALGRAHALALEPAPPPRPPPPVAPRGRARPTPTPVGARALGPPGGGVLEQARRASARLLQLVPELRGAALTRAQARLLATALALARAPAWARTPRLATALEGLERARSNPVFRRAEESPPTPPVSDAVPAPPRAPASTPGPAPEPPARLPPAGGPPARRRGADRASPGERARARRLPRPPGPARAAPPAEPAALLAAAATQSGPPGIVTGVPPSPAPRASPAPAHLPPAPAAPATPEPQRAPSARIATRFGGVFYLLNAALALELYGDFTAPRARGLDLLPWDWLALVGRALLGEEFVADPVWGLLARLAGRRPDARPDAYFRAPRDWLIPAGWLRPWGAVTRVHMQATRARLRLRHPGGFLVGDVAREATARPRAQARSLCDAYPELAGAALARGREALAPQARTARWLVWLLDYLVARLALALGLEDVARVPDYICRHVAEVEVTAAAVDVHLSLADLPLPIRIAGLDRDAGWIPAAGRSLSFHFA